MMDQAEKRIWLCVCKLRGEQLLGHRWDCPVHAAPDGVQWTTDPSKATVVSDKREET